MKNIDMALIICNKLKKQNQQLKKGNSDDWKYDVMVAKLEMLQSLLQNPNDKYTDDQG